tara:strand:- start:26671 stop:27345 length:675 start_codon:yes stop_codon:yes gene_type:complete
MKNEICNINNSWKTILETEINQKYFHKLSNILKNYREKKIIYPNEGDVFKAFKLCNYNDLKIVIIGQDPYHNINQAHGLAFSVKSKKIPPTLSNIIKELRNDVKIEIPSYGSLESWAKQGVLLINSILTVEYKKPNSHSNIGWQKFTNNVITKISKNKKGIIFMIWGNHAKNKVKLIDKSKHHILIAPHPSPLSAYRGFFGCKHFSKSNTILVNQKKKTINWNL